jgi:hypothetical protein
MRSLLLEYTTSLADYANGIPRYYVTVLCVTGEPTLIDLKNLGNSLKFLNESNIKGRTLKFYKYCDGEINAMVKGSKFRESHVLKILS